MRIAGLSLTTLGFLAGALIAVLEPERIELTLFLPALGVSAAGVGLTRYAAHRAARDEGQLDASFEVLDGALSEIVRCARELDASKEQLDVYALPTAIDEEFPPHFEAFVDARTSIAHIWGSQAYADVMSRFAAGERYLNRVWSTAADGYIDEAHASLTKAREHLESALEAFEALPRSDASEVSGPYRGGARRASPRADRR
ncbi:MAG TPA: hypothetical protein RMH99_30515 [Sandaracinaceae bacterium LLY-WYZ-13_1]|nr:hypothetical protein [Sandaracinaceae bacterium LLY-WYZ-13_1]